MTVADRFVLLCEAIADLDVQEEAARGGRKFDVDVLKRAAREIVANAVTWDELLECASDLKFEHVPGGEAEYVALVEHAGELNALAAWIDSLNVELLEETPKVN